VQQRRRVVKYALRRVRHGLAIVLVVVVILPAECGIDLTVSRM
jgi:hypothetical protein